MRGLPLKKKVLGWVLSMNVKKNKAVNTSLPQWIVSLWSGGIYCLIFLHIH